MDQSDLRRLYRLAFSETPGAAVLRDLEDRAFARESCFSADPLRMAYNEGRRSLLLHIRRMLEPEAGGHRPEAPEGEKKEGPEGPPFECVA